MIVSILVQCLVLTLLMLFTVATVATYDLLTFDDWESDISTHDDNNAISTQVPPVQRKE